MLCYRCGSYNQDGSLTCTVCSQSFIETDNEGDGSSVDLGTGKQPTPYKRNDVINERYKVRAVIGVGGVGSVYRVRDMEIDADIALKSISPNLLQTEEEQKLFSRSIRQARKLHHPNIIRIYDEGADEDRRFFTMKLLEGLTLRKIIRLRHDKGQSFTPEEIVPIFHQLAAALDYAHKTTWHGDLKPDNIIILPDLLKITDFNLVKGLPLKPFLGIAKSKSKGFNYVAPELRVEASRIDRRADIYSLGVILGEMLTGVTFEGHFSRLVTQALERLPSKLDGLVRRAVAEHPDGRFAKASELAGELDKALSAVPADGLPTPMSASERSVKKKQPPPPPAETSPGSVPDGSAEHTDEDRGPGLDEAARGVSASDGDEDDEPREIGQSQVMLLETGMSDALADSRMIEAPSEAIHNDINAALDGDTVADPVAPGSDDEVGPEQPGGVPAVDEDEIDTGPGGRARAREERASELVPPPLMSSDDDEDEGSSLNTRMRKEMRAEDLIETLYSNVDADNDLVPPPLPSDEALENSDSLDQLPAGILAVAGEAGLPSDEPFEPPPLGDDDEEEPTVSDFGKANIHHELTALSRGQKKKVTEQLAQPAPLVEPPSAADIPQQAAGEQPATRPARPTPTPGSIPVVQGERSDPASAVDPPDNGVHAAATAALPPAPGDADDEEDSLDETAPAEILRAARARSSPAVHQAPALTPPVLAPAERSAAHLRPVAPPAREHKSGTGLMIAGGALALFVVIGGVALLKASGSGGSSTTDPTPDVAPVPIPGSARVGPAGGVVELDGVTLMIPGGALADERTIRITRTDTPAPDGVEAFSPVFRFTPSDTRFLKKVKLTVPFTGAVDDAGLYFKTDDGVFQRMDGGAIAGGTLAAPLDGLGTAFIGAAVAATDAGAPSTTSGGEVALTSVKPEDPPQPDPAAEAAAKARAEEERRKQAEQDRAREEERRREAEARAEERERSRGEGRDRRAEERERKREEADRKAAEARARKEMEEREDAERRSRAEAKQRKKDEERLRKEEEKRQQEEEKRKRDEEERKRKDAEKADAVRVASSKKLGCPSKGMQLVPAGSFTFGSSASDPMRNFGENSASSVTVGAFCIDYYEFPNSPKMVPTTGVSWKAAKRACERKGKRLCTEQEWEKACKGPSNRRFPYGNNYKVDSCNTEDASGSPRPLSTAKDFKRCRSKYNVFELSGNAEEWTADAFRSGASSKVVKGGAADRPDWASRCSARRGMSPSSKKPTLGFRCCADPN